MMNMPIDTSSGKCLIIQEASSSKTAFYAYNQNLVQIGIKLLLVNPTKPDQYKIDSYASASDAIGYFEEIAKSKELIEYLFKLQCDYFKWVILSTGGMRSLESKGEGERIENFYDELSHLFLESFKGDCQWNRCITIKNIVIKTLSSEEEGRLAWSSLRLLSDNSNFAIFDLGGKTAQLTSKLNVHSDYLGKDQAMTYNINSFCDNDKTQYNGILCREEIRNYLEINFKNNFKQSLRQNDFSGDLYIVGNFYNYFNDVCNSYLPHIMSNNLNFDAQTLNKTQSICQIKQTQEESLIIDVKSYKEITDAICIYWNEKWVGNTAIYAKDACFSGNYNYEILKFLGLDDQKSVVVNFVNNGLSSTQTGWTLGAAAYFIDDNT